MADPLTTNLTMPRARLTGDERRRTILTAARSEFARVGYHGASTASIARVAGCSEPMLYKHFRNKQELFLASLRDAIERLHGVFDSDVEQAATMPEAGRTYVHRVMGDPGFQQLMRLRMLAVTITDQPGVREELEAIEQLTRDRIAAAIEAGMREGTFPADIDPEYVALGWLGFLLASCYRDALHPGTFEDMAVHVDRFLTTTFLAGDSAPTGRSVFDSAS
jgi:AcrR family transcriptional regulator